MSSIIDCLRTLNIYSMMLRILLAIVCGGLVGFERERKGRPAGFRTYMLVALGAALTVMLSQYFDLMLKGPWRDVAVELDLKTDAARLGAQVINGVGFLGAGTIIVTGRHEVKGLTTAAGLWASACMGLTAGAGFYECSLLVLFLMLSCMLIFPFIENAVVSRSLNMTVFMELDSIEDLSNVIGLLKRDEVNIYDVELSKAQHEDLPSACIGALLSVRLPIRLNHAELLAALSTLHGVVSIEEV